MNGKKPRKAAVLALFYPGRNNGTNFLLIKRAEYQGTHASQIGFPGGKYEDTDKDLKWVLRELKSLLQDAKDDDAPKATV